MLFLPQSLKGTMFKALIFQSNMTLNTIKKSVLISKIRVICVPLFLYDNCGMLIALNSIEDVSKSYCKISLILLKYVVVVNKFL